MSGNFAIFRESWESRLRCQKPYLNEIGYDVGHRTKDWLLDTEAGNKPMEAKEPHNYLFAVRGFNIAQQKHNNSRLKQVLFNR